MRDPAFAPALVIQHAGITPATVYLPRITTVFDGLGPVDYFTLARILLSLP